MQEAVRVMEERVDRLERRRDRRLRRMDMRRTRGQRLRLQRERESAGGRPGIPGRTVMFRVTAMSCPVPAGEFQGVRVHPSPGVFM